MLVLKQFFEFEWDKGNTAKNRGHGVKDEEAEEVFFDEDKVIFKDVVHSQKEERLRILGKTKRERSLFIVFTIRNKKIRIISARDINKKETHLYEKAS